MIIGLCCTVPVYYLIVDINVDVTKNKSKNSVNLKLLQKKDVGNEFSVDYVNIFKKQWKVLNMTILGHLYHHQDLDVRAITA